MVQILIYLERSLSQGNRFPQSDIFPFFLENRDVLQKLSSLHEQLRGLITELFQMQLQLLEQNPEIASKKRKSIEEPIDNFETYHSYLEER